MYSSDSNANFRNNNSFGILAKFVDGTTKHFQDAISEFYKKLF
jgi:hypothetical protein